MSEQKEKTNQVNDNESLDYPDFTSLNKSNFREFPKRTILGVSKLHFLIYLAALGFSLILIVPYAFFCQEKWQNIGMSIGASGVGAALLGYFIELAVKSTEHKRIISSYNESILTIYISLWQIFSNQSYDFMKSITPPQAQLSFAKQSAEKFITQIDTVIPKIDSLVCEYNSLFDDETADFYNLLRYQLIQFKTSLQNPFDTENLINLLNGIRLWLREYYDLSKVEKQLFLP